MKGNPSDIEIGTEREKTHFDLTPNIRWAFGHTWWAIIELGRLKLSSVAQSQVLRAWNPAWKKPSRSERPRSKLNRDFLFQPGVGYRKELQPRYHKEGNWDISKISQPSRLLHSQPFFCSRRKLAAKSALQVQGQISHLRSTCSTRSLVIHQDVFATEYAITRVSSFRSYLNPPVFFSTERKSPHT